MTLFLNCMQNIKTKWIFTILRLFCLLHDIFCLLGFFVLPIFKYSLSVRIPFLIVWFYMTVVFFALMVVVTKQQVREDKKEIVEYNNNKFVYWLGRVGVLLCFSTTFFMLFWLNNFTSNLSLIKVFCISAFLLLLLGMVIGLLTQYKGNYKQMFKDIFTAIGILFGLFIIIIGVLSYEAHPEISPFLTLCGGIPLLIWCINTFFKTVISPKFITGKDDIFTASMWLFFFIGIIISFILRYAINDCELRATLTTVMSGVLGGAITLAGVAWTLKKGESDKKETQRLTLKPWILWLSESPRTKIEYQNYYFSMSGLSETGDKIVACLKNTDNGIAILKKITTSQYEYYPIGDATVDKNSKFIICVAFDENDHKEDLCMIVEDVLHNEYRYKFISGDFPGQKSGLLEVTADE